MKSGITNATESTLRAKNMVQLYGNHIVYALRKNDVIHLLYDVRDWYIAEAHFGELIAAFRPHQRRWFYYSVGCEWHAASVADIQTVFSESEVCMLGKNCHKHRC